MSVQCPASLSPGARKDRRCCQPGPSLPAGPGDRPQACGGRGGVCSPAPCTRGLHAPCTCVCAHTSIYTHRQTRTGRPRSHGGQCRLRPPHGRSPPARGQRSLTEPGRHLQGRSLRVTPVLCSLLPPSPGTCSQLCASRVPRAHPCAPLCPPGPPGPPPCPLCPPCPTLDPLCPPCPPLCPLGTPGPPSMPPVPPCPPLGPLGPPVPPCPKARSHRPGQPSGPETLSQGTLSFLPADTGWSRGGGAGAGPDRPGSVRSALSPRLCAHFGNCQFSSLAATRSRRP